MAVLKIEISDREVAVQLFEEADSVKDMVDFVSTFVDHIEGYGYDFRDMVIKRLEADK